MPILIKTNIPDITARYRRLIATLPRLVANEAKTHYVRGFRTGGKQTDASIGGWAPRKKKSRNKTRRAILVRTGQLFGDVDVRSASMKRIILGTHSTNYASYHNEGTENMPKREFLGPSRKLDVKLMRIINKEFKKAFE